ncbi:MAG: L-serine ammonia-lyase, iron-sulfur-dependent, subunit alpha [Acholeplasmatales bacterium]|nr:L-serine ammonia-lyase, iron-sulfur-dependent, subunit alpha [Acholeplasmatales bacterium]
MYSLKELFKIGNGPSSSHTIGPKEATKEFKRRYPDVDAVVATLYGSLALTGKGHLTDYIIENEMMPIPCRVDFDIETSQPHPNTMVLTGYKDRVKVAQLKVYSVGGGTIQIDGEPKKVKEEIYPLNKFKDIALYCKDYKLRLCEYVDMIEGEEINEYIEKIYNVMNASIERGLNTTGLIPGKLHIKRKANYLHFQKSPKQMEAMEIRRRKLVSYAYAVSEENASGGEIVTSPTCGSAGILPACVRYAEETNRFTHEDIINGLKTAGLIGNLVKQNGSISGAEAGCQAEVGTACAMAAAFLVEIQNGTIDQIESAAEIALEHHLGLTCDPIEGYVQIPCIERNAVAALRAVDAANLSSYLNNSDSKISFDLVVDTMLDTGKDLCYRYRETSEGGLAKKYK